MLLRNAHVGGRLENRGCRGWKACVCVGVLCQEEMGERCDKGQGVGVEHQNGFKVHFWGLSSRLIGSTI